MRALRILRPGVVLALMLLCLPALLKAGDKIYDVDLLKSPTGANQYYPWDINDSEKIAGFFWWLEDTTWRTTAVAWNKPDASPVALKPLTGHVSTVAYSVNNRGEVGGYSGDFPYHAVIWDKDGNPKDMHPSSPFSKYSLIYEVNDLGDAAGILYVAGLPNAYFWPRKGSSAILPLYSDSSIGGRAFSVNKKGWVAGEEVVNGYTGHAVVWDEFGMPTDLHPGLVKVLPTVKYSRAWKVTDEGEVAGLAFDGFPSRPDLDEVTEGWAWVWTKKDGFSIVDRGKTDYAAIWRTDGKAFTGFIKEPNWNIEEARAAVWLRANVKGKTVYDLNVIPTLSGYTGMRALNANTKGQIVGVAYDDTGGDHAWVARPRPK